MRQDVYVERELLLKCGLSEWIKDVNIFYGCHFSYILYLNIIILENRNGTLGLMGLDI